MTSSTRVSLIVAAMASAALIISGVVMLLSLPEMAVALDGFSYEPLDESSMVDSVFLSQRHLRAAFLIVGGLVSAGTTGGFLWGHHAGGVQRTTGSIPYEA